MPKFSGTGLRFASVLYEETLRSLHAEVKALPAVWLYDARGSRLYDEITRLPEYYLPRREGEILRARAGEIAARTQARTLVELGAGSAKNIRLLLDALDTAGTLEPLHTARRERGDLASERAGDRCRLPSGLSPCDRR